MIFLELLAIAVGVIVAGTLLVVGLVEAPWPVLLVLLLVGWYFLQRLSTRNETLVNSVSNSTDEETQPKSAERQLSKLSKLIAKQSPVRLPDQTTGITDQDAEQDLESGLKYRGISYHHDATDQQLLDADDQPDQKTVSFKGKYRGRNWKRLTVSTAESQPQFEVRYRGHKVVLSNGSDHSDQ